MPLIYKIWIEIEDADIYNNLEDPIEFPTEEAARAFRAEMR